MQCPVLQWRKKLNFKSLYLIGSYANKQILKQLHKKYNYDEPTMNAIPEPVSK